MGTPIPAGGVVTPPIVLPDLDLSDPAVFSMVMTDHVPEELWNVPADGSPATYQLTRCKMDHQPWPCDLIASIRAVPPPTPTPLPPTVDPIPVPPPSGQG